MLKLNSYTVQDIRALCDIIKLLELDMNSWLNKSQSPLFTASCSKASNNQKERPETLMKSHGPDFCSHFSLPLIAQSGPLT